MSELLKVKHIGKKTAEKLIDAGITSIAQLAVKRPVEIKELLGFSLKKSKEVVNDALEKSWDKIAKPYFLQDYMKYVEKHVKRIPTGSKKLDKILRGGIPTNSVVLFTGAYATGKTELCLQLAVNCKKYYDRGTIWIETEPSTFSPNRLDEMCKAMNVSFNKKDFYIIPAREIGDSPHFQFLAYLKANKILEKLKEKIGVLVIDSFTSKFRGYYTGREMLPDRASEEQRHINYLHYTAAKYNIAVLLTAQVMELPDQTLQIIQRAKTGQVRKMWGGTVLEHGATIILFLRRASSTEWEATIVDAPDLPQTACNFKIVGSGIRD